MTSRNWIAATGLVLFIAMVQLLAAFMGVWVACIAAAGVGFALAAAHRKLFAEDSPAWFQLAIPALGTCAGSGLAVVSADLSPSLLFAPLLSLAGSTAVLVVKRSGAKRCALCEKRIGAELAFVCPRCELLVCEANCWVAEHLRCRLCLQNGVPILTDGSQWWDHRLGPRSNQGTCQYCHRSATESDLRGCRRCGRPQCRDCWDHLNGSCSRCDWVISDLPESLMKFAGPTERVSGSNAREGRY